MKIQTTRIYDEIDGAIRQGYNTVSLQGSSRSSKTYNATLWLIVYLLQHPNTRLSIVRATLPALKSSVFVDFKEILLRMKQYDEKAMNKSDMTYCFANGSWVEFFSTDSEQKLRGRKRDILFVNEANELSFLEWQQLKMRTSRFSIVDYNPSFSSDHWLVSLNGAPTTYHFISTYKDNPFLEKTIIEEIESLQYKNKTLWQVYGLGQQAMVEGLVFETFDTVDEIPKTVRQRWLGMDFGYTNDPTAIVEVAVDGDTLYIDEKCYRTRMLTGDIITELRTHAQYRGHTLEVVAESAEPREIEEIHRAGVNIHPVKKYAGSVVAGTNKLKEYRIVLTKRSTNVAKEMRNYTYAQDKDGKWLNEPVDAFNHAIDAVRYVAMEKLMGGRKKPINTSRLARHAY